MYNNTCKYLTETYPADFAAWLLGEPIALTQTPDFVQTLRDVAQRIDRIPERRQQGNLTAATELISGLAVEKQVIQQLLRSDIMKESVIYQAILKEGKQKGKLEGRREELTQAQTQIALNMLRMLRSEPAKSLIVELTGLSPTEVKALASP